MAIAEWSPVVVQWIGVAIILFELALSILHPPADIEFAAIGVTMASGGKLSDIVKRGGL